MRDRARGRREVNGRKEGGCATVLLKNNLCLCSQNFEKKVTEMLRRGRKGNRLSRLSTCRCVRQDLKGKVTERVVDLL